MRFITSLLFLTLLSSATLAQEDGNDGEAYLFEITSQKDLESWTAEVNAAVERIQANGGSEDSRSGFDDFMMGLSGLFAKGTSALKCEACKVAAGAFALITRVPFTKKPVLKAVSGLCRVGSSRNKVVCDGIANGMGSELFDVFKKANYKEENFKQMACFALNGQCPSPKFNVKPLQLPAQKTPSIKDSPSGQYKYILHLSDLHYDPLYKVGAEAECTSPICCQPDSTSNKKGGALVRPAGKWGDYRCDAPKTLLQSLLKSASKLNHELNFDMILFTGDVPAHDFWSETEQRSFATEEAAFRLIDSEFNPSKTPIYPTIGNHENVPANQFPIDGKAESSRYNLYKFISKQWSNWLPPKAITTISKAGYYSVQHNKGLKIIGLNNNFCYKYNFQLLLEPNNSDPNNMLKWLVDELLEAENTNSKVYLTSHVPPGVTDCYQHFSKQYNLIIKRFAHIITGQFYGHEHYDIFQVHYNSSDLTAKNAISTSYLAPSMTTYNGNNPAFRIYKVDANNYNVVDYTNYYADLKQSSKWDNDMDWKPLYSARETYGKNNKDPFLTPAFWHSVTENISANNELFDKFYNLRNAYGQPLNTCNAKCKSDFVCNLRSGYSGDGCLVNAEV